MEPILKSDVLIAKKHSEDIETATVQLKNFHSVGAGHTNHGVNDSCCNHYSDISAIMASYCFAGERDAERIRTIAIRLDEFDEEAGNAMLRG